MKDNDGVLTTKLFVDVIKVGSKIRLYLEIGKQNHPWFVTDLKWLKSSDVEITYTIKQNKLFSDFNAYYGGGDLKRSF